MMPRMLMNAALASVLLLPALALQAGEGEDPLITAIDQVVPTYVMIGGGSGVVISADGLMLTNHHVIAASYARKKRSFKVRVGTRFFDAQVLGTDPRGDISLLRIELEDGETLPFVPFSDSDKLIIGQEVIAIGNPFGAMQITGDPTVTLGVISLLHRNNGNYSDAIMTDAPVNPGNSGGPLLTMDGQLAGINGQIRSKTGARANTGIGMAIPANQIARFLPLLEEAEGGIVLHGHLRGLRLDNEETDGLQNGAEVKEVVAGSHAADAGLQQGDRITKVEQLPVRNGSRLRGILGTYPADSTVGITYVRGEEEAQTKVFLAALDAGVLGVEIERPKNRKQLSKLYKELRKDPMKKKPVVIKGLPSEWPAAESGLQQGDRIIAIGGEDTPNILHYTNVQRRLMAQEKFFAGDVVEITVERGKGKDAEEVVVPVTLGSRHAKSEDE